MAVQVAAQVAQLDQAREPAGERGLDLALVLAQLGLDERQAEEGVGLGLGGERAELGLGTGERLAVLADPQEPLLGQAPALVAGHRPQPDVVLLRAGEMDPVRPGCFGRHGHQVHLGPAEQADRRFGAALVDHVVDHARGT